MQESVFIGRSSVRETLEETLTAPTAEMVMIVGRRGLGKKQMINIIYKEHILFQQTGHYKATDEQQIETFRQKVEQLTGKKEKPYEDWMIAFFRLRQALESHLKDDKRQVIIFNELNWLAKSPKFLTYMGHFWNTWVCRQNLILVISSSATSWMIQNVINHRGELHNRVTKRIFLKPLNLLQIERYAQSRGLGLTRYQILQFYMAFGGVPLYWDQIDEIKSISQNIYHICFSDSGFLNGEFSQLYDTIYDNHQKYLGIIEVLTNSSKGLNIREIGKRIKREKEETILQILDTLVRDGFVENYYLLGKKTNKCIYRMIDEFSIFYHQIIRNMKVENVENIEQVFDADVFRAWANQIFEIICLKHDTQIERALGIGGVYTRTKAYYKKATKAVEGIDAPMLIERADRIINLFEIKFYDTEVAFAEGYSKQLRNFKWAFRRTLRSNKQVRLTMITPFGVKRDQNSLGVLDFQLTLDDLFLAKKDYFYF